MFDEFSVVPLNHGGRVPKLPGLEQIEVVYVQHAPTWARWTEGLMIHVIGSGMVAIIAFVLGLMAGNAGG